LAYAASGRGVRIVVACGDRAGGRGYSIRSLSVRKPWAAVGLKAAIGRSSGGLSQHRRLGGIQPASGAGDRSLRVYSVREARDVWM